MKVNGKDDIPYMMENYIQVWNHQPAIEIVDKNMDLPSYNMVIFQSIHGNTHGKKTKKRIRRSGPWSHMWQNCCLWS